MPLTAALRAGLVGRPAGAAATCSSRSTATGSSASTAGRAGTGRRRRRARRPHAARPRQRPQPRLPPRPAQPHPGRDGHVLDVAGPDVPLAATLDPDSLPPAGARRRSPRWCWPASRVSASSTTCTTHPAARGTPTRTRWARRWSRRPPKPGLRITLLDTCYLHGGYRRRRRRRREARSCGSATARRGVGRACRRARPRRSATCARSARRSTRSAPSTRRRSRRVAAWARGAARRCTPTSPSSRPENERCLAAYGRTPLEVLRRSRGARRAVHRGARHAPDDHDIDLLANSAQPRAASARRPSATSPTASGRRPGSVDAGVPTVPRVSDSHAVIDLFEEARAVELDERLAHRRRAAPHLGRSAGRGRHGRRASLRSAGPRPARSLPARSPTS